MATSPKNHPKGSDKPAVASILWVTALFGSSCNGAMTFPEFGEERIFSDHRELDVRFRSDDAELAGTIFFPTRNGPHPAVAVNPGSSWTTRATWSEVRPFVTELHVAVLVYDKRGAGQSSGTCCPAEPTELFALLANDVVAAVQTLHTTHDIEPSHIGVFGSSQGGWIVPIAASLAPHLTSFSIVTVGGAVSTGQENLYDPLTGYDVCQPTGTPMDEIIAQLKAAGPSGFDPRQSLETLVQPAIWIYGERDLSHPTVLAVEILENIREALQKNWSIVVVPNANHDFIDNGTICQTEGPFADVFTPLRTWFARAISPLPDQPDGSTDR